MHKKDAHEEQEDDIFAQYIKEGIAVLPKWVRDLLINVVFLVKDEPSLAQRKEHALTHGETLFGLYEGVPLTERGDEAVLMPDTITIFIRPIREAYESEDDIRECVRNTVWHEVAHYFGHDEAWVEAEEVRRGKTM